MKLSITKFKETTSLLFLFSLPFEYWDPFGVREFFTITKMLGFLYMGFSLFSFKSSFNIRFVKKPVVILLCLWLLLVFMTIFHNRYGNETTVFHATFLLNIILFWLLTNDLIRNKGLYKKFFASLIAGVLLMSVLIGFGFGLDSRVDEELGSFRVSFFGSNPNSIGNLAAISLFFAFHMFLMRSQYYGKLTLLILLSFPSLLSLLSFSGSRGSLLIVAVGIISLILFQKGSSTKRIVTLMVGVIFLYYGFNILMQSSILLSRLRETVETGTFGGRDEIWVQAWEIFTENPLFGIGSTGYKYEIAQRLGLYLDTHNLFLYFMVTTGIMGLILYLIFISFLLGNSRKYYNTNKDIILFGILFMYIFSVFKSGGAINEKLNWILASIIYGMGYNSTLLQNVHKLKRNLNS